MGCFALPKGAAETFWGRGWWVYYYYVLTIHHFELGCFWLGDGKESDREERYLSLHDECSRISRVVGGKRGCGTTTLGLYTET